MTQIEETQNESSAINSCIDEETFTVPGIQVIDRFFSLPLVHGIQHGPTLQVFVRQCSKSDLSAKDLASSKRLLFYQGGPGFDCSSALPSNSGMMKVLLDKGFVVLLIDQRGTGLSTPLDVDTIRLQGDLDAQVQYCKHFRADSIVRDSELIRQSLQITKWTLLGQSFGGFCVLTYLSLAPESLEAVLITGGIAPICHKHPDAVYHRLAKKIIRRNENYYEKYPDDVQKVKDIVKHLDNQVIQMRTPNGGALTSRRFRQIGIELGMHGGFDRMHNLIKKLDTDLTQFGIFTYRARAMIEDALHYDTNPVYSILHEAIYCQSEEPSNWSSERVLMTYDQLARPNDSDGPVYFFGENIFSWMFDDYSNLRPLRDLAHRLAQESWTPLYDLKRLNANRVPLAASCYIMDMYVEIDLAIESLQAIASSKDLVTNRWLHNGLRHAPEELLGYLFNLLESGEQ